MDEMEIREALSNSGDCVNEYLNYNDINDSTDEWNKSILKFINIYDYFDCKIIKTNYLVHFGWNMVYYWNNHPDWELTIWD